MGDILPFLLFIVHGVLVLLGPCIQHTPPFLVIDKPIKNCSVRDTEVLPFEHKRYIVHPSLLHLFLVLTVG